LKEIYNFKVNNSKGEEVELSTNKGKVMLIVNTASKCGFTYQYEGLQDLHDLYNKEGLEILAFPCNQFKNQESGTDKEIQSFCQLNYGLKFPVYSKIDVNGDDAHPLYKYLKKQKKGLLGSNIKWNFTKFLIDKEGNVVKRFGPTIKPESMKEDIKKLL